MSKHRSFMLTKPDMSWTINVLDFIGRTFDKVKRLRIRSPHIPPNQKDLNLLATLRIYHDKKTGEIYFRIGNHSSRTSGTWMFVEEGEAPKEGEEDG